MTLDALFPKEGRKGHEPADDAAEPEARAKRRPEPGKREAEESRGPGHGEGEGSPARCRARDAELLETRRQRRRRRDRARQRRRRGIRAEPRARNRAPEHLDGPTPGSRRRPAWRAGREEGGAPAHGGRHGPRPGGSPEALRRPSRTRNPNANREEPGVNPRFTAADGDTTSQRGREAAHEQGAKLGLQAEPAIMPPDDLAGSAEIDAPRIRRRAGNPGRDPGSSSLGPTERRLDHVGKIRRDGEDSSDSIEVGGRRPARKTQASGVQRGRAPSRVWCAHLHWFGDHPCRLDRCPDDEAAGVAVPETGTDGGTVSTTRAEGRTGSRRTVHRVAETGAVVGKTPSTSQTTASPSARPMR